MEPSSPGRRRGPWERLMLRVMGPPQLGPFDDSPDPAVEHRAAVERRLLHGRAGGRTDGGSDPASPRPPDA